MFLNMSQDFLSEFEVVWCDTLYLSDLNLPHTTKCKEVPLIHTKNIPKQAMKFVQLRMIQLIHCNRVYQGFR